MTEFAKFMEKIIMTIHWCFLMAIRKINTTISTKRLFNLKQHFAMRITRWWHEELINHEW